jgi:hypothetical protein
MDANDFFMRTFGTATMNPSEGNMKKFMAAKDLMEMMASFKRAAQAATGDGTGGGKIVAKTEEGNVFLNSISDETLQQAGFKDWNEAFNAYDVSKGGGWHTQPTRDAAAEKISKLKSYAAIDLYNNDALSIPNVKVASELTDQLFSTVQRIGGYDKYLKTDANRRQIVYPQFNKVPLGKKKIVVGETPASVTPKKEPGTTKIPSAGDLTPDQNRMIQVLNQASPQDLMDTIVSNNDSTDAQIKAGVELTKQVLQKKYPEQWAVFGTKVEEMSVLKKVADQPIEGKDFQTQQSIFKARTQLRTTMEQALTKTNDMSVAVQKVKGLKDKIKEYEAAGGADLKLKRLRNDLKTAETQLKLLDKSQASE